MGVAELEQETSEPRRIVHALDQRQMFFNERDQPIEIGFVIEDAAHVKERIDEERVVGAARNIFDQFDHLAKAQLGFVE